MKSPFTGGEVELKVERETLEFRDEEFTIPYNYYVCKDTGKEFTTDRIEELNETTLYNRYREKHKIPFPDQIKSIREKYNLSQTKMAEVLGFGVNTYRNYEKGGIPIASNANLIRTAENPHEFKKLLSYCEALSEKEKEKIEKKIESVIELDTDNEEKLIKYFILNNHVEPNIFTGYRATNFEKLFNAILFFAQRENLFKTRLNKLLFYSDFKCFKNEGFSITGMNYAAIPLGPVPNYFDILYSIASKKGFIDIEYHDFGDKTGEKYKPHPSRDFEAEFFSDIEIKYLEKVHENFKGIKTKELIKISHEEKGWLDRNEKKDLIEYDYAFELKN
mgnify:CR=1 FL=1